MMILTIIGSMLGMNVSYAGEATDYVKARHDAILSAMTIPGNEQKIIEITGNLIDFDVIAKNSLGDEWENRSEFEKKEYRALFKQLFQKSYEENLKKTSKLQVSYLKETVDKPFVNVKMSIVDVTNSYEEPSKVDFKVYKVENGKWKVIDIITDGDSTVKMYRTQFVKLTQRDGFDVLLKKLKDKLN
jgi:phospholipid transport system substrate-binding protein